MEAFQATSRSADGRHPYCKACKRDYNRRHYLANKARYVALVTTRKRERLPANRRRLWAYLLAHPCVDCGEPDPTALEFDHLDPTTKTTDVCRTLAGYRWERIAVEIDKCAVRCANCHRRKTARERGWYTARMPAAPPPVLVAQLDRAAAS